MALSRCRLRESLPSVDDCPRTDPPIPDQGWLDCLGMSGWFPSESPAGLRRNGRLLFVGIRREGEAEGMEDADATSSGGFEDRADVGVEVGAPSGSEAVGDFAKDDAGPQR